jgi:O-antigen/teichoic acid export membrane protein
MGPLAAGVVVIPLGLQLARGSFRIYFSAKALRQMLGFSLPLVFSSVGWVLASYLDRLAIKELLSFEDVAVYGVGFRIAGIVMLLMTGLQGSVSPMIFAHHAAASTPGRVAQMFRLFSALALVLCGGLSVFAPELLWVFATPNYANAAQVTPALSLSLVLARFYIFAPGLWLAKKTLLYAGINIAMGGINLGLNYVLIPYLGITGAATATLLSATATFGLVMFFSQRYYPVQHRFVPIVLTYVFGFGVMLLSAWAYQHYQVNIFIRAGSMVGICFIPFLFGLVTKLELRAAWVYVQSKWTKLTVNT